MSQSPTQVPTKAPVISLWDEFWVRNLTNFLLRLFEEEM
jgi:hypothetical protein